jgi:hypothetical protein
MLRNFFEGLGDFFQATFKMLPVVGDSVNRVSTKPTAKLNLRIQHLLYQNPRTRFRAPGIFYAVYYSRLMRGSSSYRSKPMSLR